MKIHECSVIVLLLFYSVGVSGRPLKEVEKAKQEASKDHPPVAFDIEGQSPIGHDQLAASDGGSQLSSSPGQLAANPSSPSRAGSVESGTDEETSSCFDSGNGMISDSQGEPSCEPSKVILNYPKYHQSEKKKGPVVLRYPSTNYAKGSCSSSSSTSGADGTTDASTSPNTEQAQESSRREREPSNENSYQILSIVFGNREAMDETRLKGVVSLVLLALCLRSLSRAVQKPWILQLINLLETAAIYVLSSQLITSSWIPHVYVTVMIIIFLQFGALKRTSNM